MNNNNIKEVPAKFWALFFSLYSTQYIGISFLSIVLILILRENGASLDKLSLIPLMSLPIAFKALWAPFIDKHLKTNTGHYRNWLLVAQFLMISCLFIISFVDPLHEFSLILLVIFIFSFMTATQDLALSGLICNIFDAKDRYLISSVKSGGFYVWKYYWWGSGFIIISLYRLEWMHVISFGDTRYHLASSMVF
ncbi:hypothetical protein [Providencia vermicola]|uniref:hypothetical protein n=1 Tax=Providencia vermicola TaxID=333965 RepID=UPI0034DD88CC